MTLRSPILPSTVCLLALACNSSGGAKIDETSATTPTDCVTVVGGADCQTGTGTGGTGTGGTGTGGTGTTEGIDTWVGSDNPGTGPGGDLYRVEARVDADREDLDGGGFAYVTDMRVDVWDTQDQPLSGLEVHLDTLSAGDTLLVEDPGNPGRYEAQVDVYARTYTLKIEPTDPLSLFEAEVVGPENHLFQAWEPEPWDIAGPDVTVRWAPDGASFASIDTRGTGTIDIDDDGAYDLPVGQLDHEAGEVGEERVRVRRWEQIDLTGALPGSWFRVGVRIEKDPVDTTDSRSGQLQGDVELDPAFAGETGDVFVVAWPDALDPQNDPFSVWTTIPDGDFTDLGSYLATNLEPGDWYVLAWLDADGSDAGGGRPDGPTDGDPYDDADVTIDPDGTTIRDFTLDRTWQGW